MRRIPFFLVAAASLLAVSGPALAAATVTPTNSSLPTISGNDRSGQTLTASSGSWSGTTPINYAYQWQRCNPSGSGCAAIGGASDQNYVASSGDVGKTVRVQVTASNSDGSNQALSGPTGTIASPGTAPASTRQPNPSGTAQDGQTVTVDNGAWSGETPITFSFQWQVCGSACTDIAGATSRSYQVGTTEVGSALRATVTATNAAGKSSSFSNLTSVVTAKSAAPLNTSVPVISGSLLVGHTLQASSGAWSGLGTTGFGYQWARCNSNGTSCASISGATGQSYGVGQVDLGAALRVNVTATNSTGTTSASSAASLIAAATMLSARFNAVLRTGQEVSRPLAASTRAAGHFTGRLTGKTLRWTLTFSHLSGRPTVSGLNKGLRGANGAAFKTLCRHCLTASHGTLVLTASQLDAMLGGGVYVNIHTPRNPAGEIRGQLIHLG